MDFSQAEIGYLFQYPEHQIFEPNIYKEISYGARKRKWKEEVILEKAKEVLTLVGLDQTYLSRSSFHLSGGEKRRIALASVLITDPELLILDEATVGLDSKGKKQLFEIILKWQKKNKRSLLFITHHMDDVLDYAEEVLVMKEGKILSHTTPSLLFQQHSSSLENLGLVLPTRVQFLNQLNQKLSEKLEIHGNLTEENILAVLEEKSQNKGKKE